MSNLAELGKAVKQNGEISTAVLSLIGDLVVALRDHAQDGERAIDAFMVMAGTRAASDPDFGVRTVLQAWLRSLGRPGTGAA